MFSVPCQWKAEELLGGKPDRELKLQASYQSQRSSFHLVYFETPEGLAGSSIPGDSTSFCSSTEEGAGQFCFSIPPWAGGRACGSGFAFSIPWRGSLGAAVEGAGPSCLFQPCPPASLGCTTAALGTCRELDQGGCWAQNIPAKKGLKERMGSFPLLCD